MLVQVTSGPVSDWRICSLFGVLGWARCLREQWETRKCQVEGEFPRGETALFAPGALLALMFRQCCLVSSWAVIAVLRGAGHTFFKEVKKAGEVYSGCEWARRGWSSNLSSRRSMGPGWWAKLGAEGSAPGTHRAAVSDRRRASRWLMIVTVASRRTIMCVLRWCCVWWQMFYTHMLQQAWCLVPRLKLHLKRSLQTASSSWRAGSSSPGSSASPAACSHLYRDSTWTAKDRLFWASTAVSMVSRLRAGEKGAAMHQWSRV